MLNKGYIQVYTGDGKGKTTAALGVAMRAACSGNKVFFGQFMKGQETSELKLPIHIPNFTIEHFGTPSFYSKSDIKIVEKTQKAFERMKGILLSEEYDVVVFDEINTAIYFSIIPEDDVLKLLDLKPENTEVILTGIRANQKIIDRADLVTEMKEVKHYYNKGVRARLGIEF